MSVYAKAMAEATKIVLGKKKNPQKEYTIKWNTKPTMNDNSWESLKATSIGQGAFAEVYLGIDNMVYIYIEDNTDPSKELLAHINKVKGSQPHIPIIKQIGFYSIDHRMYGKVRYTVFQSPLYRVPLKKNEDPENFAIMQILDQRVENAYRALSYNEKRGCESGRRVRTIFLRDVDDNFAEIENKLEKAKDMDVVKAVDEFESIMIAIELIFKFANNYGERLYPEFPSENLGTDANGQLILLDILYDKAVLIEKNHGIKC